jgi:hypothetical protein
MPVINFASVGMTLVTPGGHGQRRVERFGLPDHPLGAVCKTFSKPSRGAVVK